MILGMTIFGVLLVTLWVVFPLVSAGYIQRMRVSDASARDQIEAKLAALRDLNQQKEQGNVSEADFVPMERGLMLDLAKLYETHGTDDHGRAFGKISETGDKCHVCGSSRSKEFRFCPSCGASYLAA